MRFFRLAFLSLSATALVACSDTTDVGGSSGVNRGLSLELQAVDADRVTTVSVLDRRAQRFELRDGDCTRFLDRGNTRDCETFRERVEFFSRARDSLGETACYGLSILLPRDFAEMDVKSTFMQLHDVGYGDAVSIRYLQGRMWLNQTLGNTDIRRQTLDYRVGEWNDFFFRVTPGHGADGSIELWLNGEKVISDIGSQTIASDMTEWYFKYGIYRSGLDRSRFTEHPTQVAYFSDVSRVEGFQCENFG